MSQPDPARQVMTVVHDNVEAATRALMNIMDIGRRAAENILFRANVQGQTSVQTRTGYKVLVKRSGYDYEISYEIDTED